MKIGNYQFEWYKIPTPKKTFKKITASQLKTLTKVTDIKIADGYYDLLTKKDMDKVIKLNRFTNNNYKYTSRVRDCDDYAYALMGMVRKLLPGVCFGIVWMDVNNYDGKLLYKHALNFYVDDKKNFWLVEPQSNKTFPLMNRMKPYFITL